MPNYCLNHVEFFGSEERKKELFNVLFSVDHKNYSKSALNELLMSKMAGPRIFLDIQKEDESTVQFQTAWSAAKNELVLLANHFGLEFDFVYEELGSEVYGVAGFKANVFAEIELNHEDFARYRFDTTDHQYRFDGKKYESVYDILDILIDERKKSTIYCTVPFKLEGKTISKH